MNDNPATVPRSLGSPSAARMLLGALVAAWLLIAPVHCLEATDVEITIFHTNDLHQNLASLSRIAGFVAGYKRSHPQTLFVDAGDWFDRGSSLVTLTRGEAIYGAMASMGYDMWIVGNHDWAYGGPRLLELMKRYPVPVLGTNLATTRPPLPENLVRTIIKDIGGIRIGFFGITLDTYGKNPKARPNLYVLDCRSETEKVIGELKQANVDLIVAITHLGFKKMPHEIGRSLHPSDIDLAKAYPDIDIIVGGHSHTRLEEPTVRKVHQETGAIIVQAGGLGQYLGRLTLTVNGDTRAITNYHVATIPVTETTPEHGPTASFIGQQYRRHLPNAKAIVGEFSQPMEFYNLAFWYADFVRRQADADLCLLPRKSLYDEPRSFPARKISVETLCGYLYDRYLIRGTVSGADLLRYCRSESRKDRFNPFHHQGRPFSGDAIFYSGFDVTYDTASHTVQFDIDPKRTYTMAVPWPYERRDIARYRHRLPPRADVARRLEKGGAIIQGLTLHNTELLARSTRQRLIDVGLSRGLAFRRPFSEPKPDWKPWTADFEAAQRSRTDGKR